MWRSREGVGRTGRRQGDVCWDRRRWVAGGPMDGWARTGKWGQAPALVPDPSPFPRQPGAVPGCSDLQHLIRWHGYK